MHPFVLAKLHRRLLHSASRLSDEGQRVILPSENVDSIRCPPFCQCTYGPRFSICFCTYKWVNLHSYKKALKCYHIWNCWTQSLWFCPFYFLHKTIRSKICPKPYVMNKKRLDMLFIPTQPVKVEFVAVLRMMSKANNKNAQQCYEC